MGSMTDPKLVEPDGEIPAGMKADARESWPPKELIDSYLGPFDFEFRPGEHTDLPSDDEAVKAAARRFRDVLGRFCSGVTVVTAMSGGTPVGMTCQSFSSVSLNPPLVMFIPARTSRAWPLMQRAGRFCVNFLAADQTDLSDVMASRGVDKFAGVPWHRSSATGSPLLDDSLGYVDCTIHAVHEAGDHFVVIGRVQDLALGSDRDPLLFFQGQYHTTRS
jgi:3-hydroxy-9,10-secoandrosta-1,3,5(10)-triene-9,17-dione monooxygenase reductase component